MKNKKKLLDFILSIIILVISYTSFYLFSSLLNINLEGILIILFIVLLLIMVLYSIARIIIKFSDTGKKLSEMTKTAFLIGISYIIICFIAFILMIEIVCFIQRIL